MQRLNIFAYVHIKIDGDGIIIIVLSIAMIAYVEGEYILKYK